MIGSRSTAVAGVSAALLLGGFAATSAVATPRRAAASSCTETSPDGSYSDQDLNNDTHSDLAVGVPSAAVGGNAGAGVVDVRYRLAETGSGSVSTADQRISAADLGQTSAAGDHFGASVAVANVDGDHCLDLVIGAPGASGGSGRVYIAHGSVNGVTASGVTVLKGSISTAGDQFGAAVAASGRRIWVGAPGAAVDGRHAGEGLVFEYTADANGVPREDTFYWEGSAGITGHLEANDHFGAVLAAADDQTLLIGEPDEDVGSRTDAGTVTVLRFSDRYGLTSALTVSQDYPGIGGSVEAGDRFGASVAAYGPGPTVAIGVPGEDFGKVTDAGIVQVLEFGHDRAPRQTLALSQDTPTISGGAESGDTFGASVLLGGFVTNSYNQELDLAVGVPGEDFGTTSDVGQVNLIVVSSVSQVDGKSVPGTQAASPRYRGAVGAANLGGTTHANDRAGAGLSALAFANNRGTSGTVDQPPFRGGDYLVVAIPGDDTGATDAGSLSVHGDAVRAATPVAGQRYGVGVSTVANGPYSPPQ